MKILKKNHIQPNVINGKQLSMRNNGIFSIIIWIGTYCKCNNNPTIDIDLKVLQYLTYLS